MKREDVHRPSAVNPDDYEFVGYEFIPKTDIDPLGWASAQAEERARIAAHMQRTGGKYSQHQHGGVCHICGAWAVYTVCFYHRPTNTYIRTGSICADKMEMAYGDGFDAFKRHVHDHLLARAGKRKATALLAERGLSRAEEVEAIMPPPSAIENGTPTGLPLHGQNGWERNPNRWPDRKYWLHTTIGDLLYKLRKWGSLSDAQWAFLESLCKQWDEFDAEQRRRDAEDAAAAPAPSGRVTFSGEVLTHRVQESDFGSVHKMLVRANDGWKVWVTVPSGCPYERGSRVTLTATLTVSKDDPKFAFGKRPHYKQEVKA